MGTPAWISMGVGKAAGSTRFGAEASGLTQGNKRRHSEHAGSIEACCGAGAGPDSALHSEMGFSPSPLLACPVC